MNEYICMGGMLFCIGVIVFFILKGKFANEK